MPNSNKSLRPCERKNISLNKQQKAQDSLQYDASMANEVAIIEYIIAIEDSLRKKLSVSANRKNPIGVRIRKCVGKSHIGVNEDENEGK